MNTILEYIGQAESYARCDKCGDKNAKCTSRIYSDHDDKYLVITNCNHCNNEKVIWTNLTTVNNLKGITKVTLCNDVMT